MANGKPRGAPFKKGDPRINRKGRPKSFDALRTLGQQIAHEIAKSKDGRELIIDGHKVTVTEAIMRQWATSKNPKLQQLFIEVSYGKVPNVTELTGKGGDALNVILGWGDNADA